MYVVVNAPALFVARHSSPETTLSHPPPFAPTPLPTGRTRTHARAHTRARRHYLQRDGCPKIVNLGSAKTDLFYERKKFGFKQR